MSFKRLCDTCPVKNTCNAPVKIFEIEKCAIYAIYDKAIKAGLTRKNFKNPY